MEYIVADCLSKRRNTGWLPESCIFDPSTFKGSILVPYGFSFACTANSTDATIRAAAIAAITAALANDNPLLRAYVIGQYVNFDDKSEAQVMQKYNYGVEEEANRGKIKYEFQVKNGGLGYFLALKSFHALQDMFKVIHFDDKRVYCTNKVDGTGALVGGQGFSLDFLNVPDFGAAKYDARAMYKIGFNHSNGGELNEEIFAIDLKQNVLSLCKSNAVIDVKLQGSMTGTRIAKVSIKTLIGGVDLGAKYTTLLADTTLYVAANKTTGAAITISSIGAYDPITGTYTFTFASTGGYSVGQTLTLRTAAVSAMNTATVGNLESNVLELVMN